MPIKTDPVSLYREVKDAERFRAQFTDVMKELIGRYVGRAYGDDPNKTYEPENHAYEYLSLTIPKIIHDNPAVSVKTRRPGSQKEVAKAIEHGLNRWIADSRFRKPLLQVAVDMSFGFGVTLTTREPAPGYSTRESENAFWPCVYRISPRRFIIDPSALSFEDARYIGHQWCRDVDEILEEAKNNPEAGWDVEAIQQCKTTKQLPKLTPAGGSDPDEAERTENAAYEIWVPDAYDIEDHPGPENGFHGTIYTIACTPGEGSNSRTEPMPKEIRKPRPFYGPSIGPYTMYGVYVVPDSVIPLSPLMATAGQSQELNETVKAANKAIRKYKRIVMYDSTNPDLGRKLIEGQDQWVYPVENLDKNEVVSMEQGGITQQHLEQIQLMRERLDRNSGIHDAQRGNVDSDAKATTVAIADQASTLRIDHQKARFTDSVSDNLMKVAWYMYHDDEIVFPLGEEAADELGMVEPWFQGGSHDEGSGARFADLELDIDPYSMERTNEQVLQRRFVEMHGLLMEAIPLMIQAGPILDWEDYLDRMGQVLNDPNLSDILNLEVVQQLTQQLIQPGAQGYTTTGLGVPGAGQQQQQLVNSPRQLQGNQQGALLGAANRSM